MNVFKPFSRDPRKGRMKKIQFVFVLVTSLISFQNPATAKGLHKTFLPPNQLHLMDRFDGSSNIDQALFEQISDEAINFFQTYANLHKGKLTVNKLWDDSTVNASAEQDEAGTDWTVNMYGGLARRLEVTPDGFRLVVCHELGHHFGGFAYYSDTPWAAAEGQSDYFATQACAKAMWADQAEENAKHRDKVAASAKDNIAGFFCGPHQISARRACRRASNNHR